MPSEEDRRVADCLHHRKGRRGGGWTADVKESEGELERRGDAGDAGDGGEGARPRAAPTEEGAMVLEEEDRGGGVGGGEGGVVDADATPSADARRGWMRSADARRGRRELRRGRT